MFKTYAKTKSSKRELVVGVEQRMIEKALGKVKVKVDPKPPIPAKLFRETFSNLSQ